MQRNLNGDLQKVNSTLSVVLVAHKYQFSLLPVKASEPTQP